MKKRIISLILAAVLMFSVVSVTSVSVSAASDMKASEDLIAVLKSFEGFLSKPVWDYGQFSVGYGSRVEKDSEEFLRYMEEGIPEEEADALLRVYVAVAEKAVNKLIDTYGLTLSQQQFDAMIDFSYNCGTGWTTKDYVIRDAVINGATGTEFLNAIASWCKAGDSILSGLIRRRFAEANMYLNGVYSISAPSEYCYVLYNAKGGYCAKAIQAFQSSEVVTALPEATRSNYKFLGWYTASSGGTQVTQLDSSLTGRTLYAQWENLDGTPEEAPVEVPVNYKRVINVTSSLNVREEPSTSSSVVKTLYDGDVVTIVAEYQPEELVWGKLEEGGWIALKYTEEYVETEEPEMPDEPDTPEEPEEPETPEEPEAPEEPEVPDEPETPETPEDPETPEEPETPTAAITAKVTGSVVNVRSGAGTVNGVTGKVYRGDTVTITEVTEVGGAYWGKIADSGWICLTYTDYTGTAEEPEAPETPEEPEVPEVPSGDITVKVTNGPLNVRSGAGTGNAVISGVYNGQTLTITEVKEVDGRPWGKISGSGWICLSYTDYTGSTTTTPETPSVTTGTKVTVTGSALNVRSGAGTGYGVISAVYRGTSVTIVETTTVGGAAWGKLSTGGWVALQYTDYSGSTGSAGGTTTETPSTGTGTMTGKVNTSSLRIRSTPGMSGAVVGGLTNGAQVVILEQKTVDGMVWGRISSGWISMSYVSTSGGSTGGTSSSTSYTVTGTVVNVRNGAGTGNAVISTVTKGTKVTIIETASADNMTWGKLSSGGWISMTYVA